MSATIRLCDAEQKIARWIGQMRSRANRAGKVKDGKIGPQSAEDTDVNGFAAEMAFCKMFNVYPDFVIGPRRGSVDCVRFGQSIDIKSTVHQHGHLYVLQRKRELAADYYALVVVDWPEFRFAGFASAAEVLLPERVTDFGSGPTYVLDQTMLRWEMD